MTDVHTGRCACGAVSYEARGALRPLLYCHCDSCRRQSGHFIAATAVEAPDLTVHGAENLAEWQASPEAVRQFCRVCGSTMFWRGVGRRAVSIMAGSLDKPAGVEAWGHIFVAEKGDYYGIDDGLPQHAYWPPKL